MGVSDPPPRPRPQGLADDRLADLLIADGCPVCGFRAQASRRYLLTVLREGVTDRTTRAELDAAGGYCRRHSREVLLADRSESGGSLGSAILYASIARRRLAALDLATGAPRRRTRAQVAAARRPPACPACSAERSATDDAVARFVDLVADRDWAAALSRAEFCFDDLLLLWEAALKAPSGGAGSWPAILEAQRARMAGIERDLAGFAHHSSQDRRHLKTAAETASIERGRRLLGGDEG